MLERAHSPRGASLILELLPVFRIRQVHCHYVGHCFYSVIDHFEVKLRCSIAAHSYTFRRRLREGWARSGLPTLHGHCELPSVVAIWHKQVDHLLHGGGCLIDFMHLELFGCSNDLLLCSNDIFVISSSASLLCSLGLCGSSRHHWCGHCSCCLRLVSRRLHGRLWLIGRRLDGCLRLICRWLRWLLWHVVWSRVIRWHRTIHSHSHSHIHHGRWLRARHAHVHSHGSWRLRAWHSHVHHSRWLRSWHIQRCNRSAWDVWHTASHHLLRILFHLLLFLLFLRRREGIATLRLLSIF